MEIRQELQHIINVQNSGKSEYTYFERLQPQNSPWEGDDNWISADLVRTFFNGSQYCKKGM